MEQIISNNTNGGAEAPAKKPVVFSGIQPSGILTLGNYVGALRNFVKMQDGYESYYCVVDQHAITVRQDPAQLRKRSIETAALFIASGLDPQKVTLFIQSHVPEHAMLAWVLDCHTYVGELNRMTQFKDKSAKHADNINAGLFTYPVLMVADILLYQTDLVPIGADQKQHLELTRDVAERFNRAYGDTFVIPDAYIPKVGARVMSLQDPTMKMSKSDPNPNGYISMLDEPDAIVRKLKRAVTDSFGEVTADPERAGVYNLLSIYCTTMDKTMDETVAEFEGKGYGVLKNAVADAVVATLEPIQKEYKRILTDDRAYLLDMLKLGAEKAQKTASKTVRKVYHKMGFDSYK